MALITAPAFLNKSMEKASLRLSRVDFMMRSAYTRKRQVLAWPSGSMWIASCNVPSLEEPQAGDMRAFLADMDGRVNTFHMPVPGYRTPSNGYAGPAGKVMGADQTGYSITTDGWAADQTVLPRGAYVHFNGELKLLTAPLVTNGAGEGTMYFQPAVRKAPPNNADIIYTDPYAVMCLSESDGAGWDLSAPVFHSFQLNVEEALDQ